MDNKICAQSNVYINQQSWYDVNQQHWSWYNANQQSCWYNLNQEPWYNLHILLQRYASGSEQVRIPSPSQPNDVDEAMPVKMMEELDNKKAKMERTARAMRRQEMKAKRSQQKQQIPFISGGNYKDDCKVEGKLEDENEEPEEEEQSQAQMEFDETAKEKGQDQVASTSSATIKSENAEWINGIPLIMQIMQRMGYEQGKGLGKRKQGILDPIQPVMNPGKLALGAEKKEKVRPKPQHKFKYRMPPAPAANTGEGANTNANDGQDGQSTSAEDDDTRAKRMRFETQAAKTLRRAGLCQSDASEVWQAIETLAKHGIMNHGMGFNLVQKGAKRIRKGKGKGKRGDKKKKNKTN